LIKENRHKFQVKILLSARLIEEKKTQNSGGDSLPDEVKEIEETMSPDEGFLPRRFGEGRSSHNLDVDALPHGQPGVRGSTSSSPQNPLGHPDRNREEHEGKEENATPRVIALVGQDWFAKKAFEDPCAASSCSFDYKDPGPSWIHAF
jgi:hypothetical protein